MNIDTVAEAAERAAHRANGAPAKAEILKVLAVLSIAANSIQ